MNSVPASEPAPMRFSITLERMDCFADCPAYKVTIHGNGKVDWEGIENVMTMGRLDGKSVVPRNKLEKLARQVDAARFFDRNHFGEINEDLRPQCSTTGSTTTCSFSSVSHFCSDTVHARLTVSRNGRTHDINNDHCDAKPGLDELEDMVDRLAGTAELIGR